MPLLALVANHDDTGPANHAEWVAALRVGEPAAIAECYRQYADGLLALAYRLSGNRHDAEDIVHDVFVGLPEALAAYQERGQFSNWLKRVTARRSLMHRRKTHDRRETPRDVDVLPAPVQNGESTAHAAGIRSAISEALQSLSPALKAVFVLKMVEGFSHADIARTLGISVGTSEVRLNRAVGKLRQLLGGHRS